MYGNNRIFLKNASADFSTSNFEHPENVEFVNVDLSKAKLSHCLSIDKIGRFEKIEWAEKKDGRKAVYDEVKVEKEPENYEFIAEIYRRLRLNYERNLRFAEAGDFYIGEIEMRRKNTKPTKNYIEYMVIKNYIGYMVITLYNLFSRYGESYKRPIVWMFVVILLFALLYMPIVSWNPFDFKPDDIFLFWKYLEKSILIFIQMPPLYVKIDLLVAAERILGLFFTALFVLALRRKFKKGGE